MTKKQYLSIPELARLLSLSRTAVYKKVKKGEIKAIKIGRNYAIPLDFVKKLTGDIRGGPLTRAQKAEIDKVIERTISEYGEVLRLLGDE